MTPTFIDREFWRLRIVDAINNGQIHQCIYLTDIGTWNKIQDESREIIQKVIKRNESILDVGCGMGYLTKCLPVGYSPLLYTGVDSSPDLIALARIYHPGYKYDVCDATCL